MARGSLKRFIWLILLLPLFFSCRPDAPKLDKAIVKRWSADSAAYLSLSKNNRFEHTLYDSLAAGTWELQENVLVLNYDAGETISPLDSAVYSLLGNKPAVKYYNRGREVARISENRIEYEQEKEYFTVTGFSDNHLTLQGNDKVFTLEYIPTAVYEGNLNLASVLRGLLGLLTLVFICWLFSGSRKNIDWKTAGIGLLIQIVFAVVILKVPVVQQLFEACSKFFIIVLNFTREGSTFVFGGLVNNTNSFGFIFAFQVLPAIIFFSALTSFLFYLGILQKLVYGLAWGMKKTMRLSGAESLAAAGNIFLGQTEAPLLIKPYIDKMTRSELFCLMCGGMATIAGGVLAAYVGFLGGDDPVQQLLFAKHLLAASVMSAPAAVVAAKMLIPEQEQVNTQIEIPRERIGGSALEAIANGTTEGLKLAVNVGAMLVVFIAFIAMANYILTDIIGYNLGLNDRIQSYTSGQYSGLTLQFILGYTLKPLAWLMGVSWQDSAVVGQLLGEKTILNEFVGYVSLGALKEAGAFAEQKSIIIATYILCGFANFSSIGIQIGGIGVLAPDRRGLLSRLGMRALLGGTIASLFTAVVVGMLL